MQTAMRTFVVMAAIVGHGCSVQNFLEKMFLNVEEVARENGTN
jgi:hypothetical protein